MAIFAGVSRYMNRMVEHRTAGPEVDLLYRMAPLAIGFHAESTLAVMASTARTPLFHISHGGTLTLFTGFKYAVVTFNAFEHTGMHRMTEGCAAGLLELENDVYGGFMTGAAITLDTECGRAIVAGTARCPLLHLAHGIAFIVRPGIKQFIMAISAGIHGKVFVMVEAGVVRKQNFLDRMTFAARLDTKNRLAIMTGAARFALLHVTHTVAAGSGSGSYNTVMTGAAG